MDKYDVVVSEEFYDNLVTCDIKSVDSLLTALLVETRDGGTSLHSCCSYKFISNQNSKFSNKKSALISLKQFGPYSICFSFKSIYYMYF